MIKTYKSQYEKSIERSKGFYKLRERWSEDTNEYKALSLMLHEESYLRRKIRLKKIEDIKKNKIKAEKTEKKKIKKLKKLEDKKSEMEKFTAALAKRRADFAAREKLKQQKAAA